MRFTRQGFAALVLTLLASSLVFVTSMTATAPSAGAAPVPKSSCTRYDPNARTGTCYRFPNGQVTWLGNFTAANGRVFFCIDKNKDSRLPATAAVRSTKGLKNQFGWTVGAAEVSALNYIVDKWGSGTNTTQATAIAYIVRLVMSDTGGQFPMFLKVGQTVPNISGGLPADVLATARSMWNEASDRRGSWSVDLKVGNDGPVTIGQTRTVYANVTSGAKKRLGGVKINLTYSAAVTGPKTVTSRANEATPITIKAVKAGAMAISGKVEGPSANGFLFIPANTNIQRGWISDRSQDSSTIKLEGVVEKNDPRVFTASSSKAVRPGVPFHDTLRVLGWPAGQKVTAIVKLYGPFTSNPGASSCTDAKRVRTRTVVVSKNGTYKTPPVNTPSDKLREGLYTWVATLPATPLSKKATHACGLAAETTRVTEPLTNSKVATQVSTQKAEIGDSIRDTMTVTLTAPAVGGVKPSTFKVTEAVRVTWTAVWAPAVNGSCAGVNWDTAKTLATGTIVAVPVGTYRNPYSVTKQTTSIAMTKAGCVSYGEDLLDNKGVNGYHHPTGLVSQTTLVNRVTPTVSTQVSNQQVYPGVSLTDQILVAGLPGTTKVPMEWTLLGPVAPVNGSCAGLNWSGARIHDQDTITVGNGTTTTRPSEPIGAVGCYSYGETMPETDVSNSVTHAVGQITQTTLVVKGNPKVETQVSTTKSIAGVQLTDRVMVSGIPARSPVTVQWVLSGPLPPKKGQCTGLKWNNAPIHDKGSFQAPQDGEYTTVPSKVLAATGCYTYAEYVDETPTTNEANHTPGKPSQTTLIFKETPAVRTMVSDKSVKVGDRLTDQVWVSGIPQGVSVTVEWRLHGPKPPVKGTCSRVKWKNAKVFDRGSFVADHNGVYKTRPSKKIKAAGCYTYSETLRESRTTHKVEHKPGKPTQTTVANKHRPQVKTMVSHSKVRIGTRLSDRVWVSGIPQGVTVTVKWRLYGPLAPVKGACAGLNWKNAKVADHGSFKADHNGVYKTRLSKKLNQLGCYTYGESLPGTPATHETEHKPGKPSQTTIVVNPGRPDIPTGVGGWE